MDWRDNTAQSWDWDDGTRGYDIRTVFKIKEITDVSIVTNPAYESTSGAVHKRFKDSHLDELKNQRELEDLKKDLELMKIENELL